MSLDLVTLALAKKYTDDADARTDEQIARAVEDYMGEHPVEVPEPDLTGVVKSVNGKTPDENGNVEITIPDSSQNAAFKTDETLILENGILSVNTTNDMEQDNTLPITSAGVYTTVGNIEALLKTI